MIWLLWCMTAFWFIRRTDTFSRYNHRRIGRARTPCVPSGVVNDADVSPRSAAGRGLLFFVFAFAGHGENVTNSLGFTGPEIYPIDDDISLLHAADLNGDGLNDLIVANNLRSKINLLYNRTGKTNQRGRRQAGRANWTSTNCRRTRASALIPFPWTSASAQWW